MHAIIFDSFSVNETVQWIPSTVNAFKSLNLRHTHLTIHTPHCWVSISLYIVYISIAVLFAAVHIILFSHVISIFIVHFFFGQHSKYYKCKQFTRTYLPLNNLCVCVLCFFVVVVVHFKLQTGNSTSSKVFEKNNGFCGGQCASNRDNRTIQLKDKMVWQIENKAC